MNGCLRIRYLYSSSPARAIPLKGRSSRRTLRFLPLISKLSTPITFRITTYFAGPRMKSLQLLVLFPIHPSLVKIHLSLRMAMKKRVIPAPKTRASLLSRHLQLKTQVLMFKSCSILLRAIPLILSSFTKRRRKMRLILIAPLLTFLRTILLRCIRRLSPLLALRLRRVLEEARSVIFSPFLPSPLPLHGTAMMTTRKTSLSSNIQLLRSLMLPITMLQQVMRSPPKRPIFPAWNSVASLC
mmetsp:Transcript_27608/g.64752  ORF Transcript_27608/g.64752 Transcript_27608/m.64752 type:complete len:241 (+) Transcript_27608:502-1224(+)